MEFFPQTDAYKQALLAYFDKGHILHFDESEFSDERYANFLIALKSYWSLVRKVTNPISGYRMSQAQIMDLDSSRFVAHEEAAEELEKLGLAPNTRIGRVIVHFYSIDQGIDAFDPYRDERRLRAA